MNLEKIDTKVMTRGLRNLAKSKYKKNAATRMKISLTIFLSVILFSAAAQDAKSDSIIFQEQLERFINREFFTLTSNMELNGLESKYGIKINTLGRCYAVFSHGDLVPAQLAHLTARIEEIAKLLFDEGTPIYLSVGGSQSVESTAKQRQKIRMSNLTSVSLGNNCIVEKSEEHFEEIFNQKMLQLIGR